VHATEAKQEYGMRIQDFARATAGVLAAALVSAAALVAQADAADVAQARPEPATMTDTAPLPASDRDSVGAVILMDEPVLAQREAMAQAQARSEVDTRSMGAGPAQVLRDVMLQERQNALDEQQRRSLGR
jgi:hypothetical protein